MIFICARYQKGLFLLVPPHKLFYILYIDLQDITLFQISLLSQGYRALQPVTKKRHKSIDLGPSRYCNYGRRVGNIVDPTQL